MLLKEEIYTDNNNIERKKTYYGYHDENGNIVVTSVFDEPNIEEPIDPEPTQLDRIEEAINKSQQDIIDEYTLELIEGGVI